MTEKEKDGVRSFRKIFQNMTLKEMDEWINNHNINESNAESDLEFEIIDDCNAEEYIKKENLVMLDDIATNSYIDKKRKTFFYTYDRN